MARIPDGEIERLKAEVSVERLVEASGVALKKTGRDLAGKCPFHEDDTASLIVTPGKNLWHCFGCGAGGGPIDWVMKRQGVSFRHAVALLKEGLPSLAAEAASRPVKQTTVRRLPAPVALDADDAALLDQVVGYYHEPLKQSPEALAYLKARGLDHPELIDAFRLGYANRSLGLRLPEKNRVAGAEIRSRLQKIGLYRESGHEHFNGSLVIPVMDEAGHVVEVYGRKLLDNLRAGTPKHLYLPTREGRGRGVFNVQAFQAGKEIILCEALIDALTFWSAGYRNVTSAYGIEGFTDELLDAFKRFGTERVLIAYDRDAAGERGAEKVAERLMAEGIEAWRVQFPKGMDANEYALKVAPAAKSLGITLRKALWLGKGTAPARAPVAEPSSLAADPPAPPSPEASPVLAPPPPLAAQAVLPEPQPASPVPPAPVEIEAQVKDAEVVFTFGDRRWRVRGLSKNLAYEVLKVNVLVAQGEAYFVDAFDLYQARARQGFLTQAAVELRLHEDVLRRDLGRVLLKLEALQDAAIQQTLTPKASEPVAMAEADRAAALGLLTAPDLVDRILADFEACGLTGEATNKLVGYLAAVSRKLDAPLAILIQSSSAAGKSSLMDAVLALLPEEERIQYSAMTGQSLFYMGETNLKHKVLAIAEEEGASRAAYALKLLQSEGELTIASTGKDPQSGNLVTQQYRVEGPVMLMLTTTAAEIDEELQNRCLVLTVDEGREQTKAIHARQRDKRTLAGLLARADKDAIRKVHQDAQRLLRPLAVLNPWAGQLTFPDTSTRLRRDHEKYLTLIDAIALLHQYQRQVKTVSHRGQALEYIEVELADIALANRLAHEVLGRSLDELPPQTRRLLELIGDLVEDRATALEMQRRDWRFSRKTLREATGWGDTQLKVHLARLVELEYLLPHRGADGRFEYELLYAGGAGDGRPHLAGLLDVAALGYLCPSGYDGNRSGAQADQSAPGRGEVGARSVAGRVEASAASPGTARDTDETVRPEAETHIYKGNGRHRSYPHLPPLPLAAHGR